MTPIYDSPALSFVANQAEHIAADVMARAYPDITYMTDIPVDTSAPEWAAAVAFTSSDDVGAAAVVTAAAGDIPLINTQRDKHTVAIEMAAIGYQFSLEEIGQAQMMGQDLSAEGANAARKAYERFLDDVAYVGNPAIGDGEGLYTLSTIGEDVAATPWASAANADAILGDIHALLTAVHVDSNGIESANVMKLPLDTFALLATTRISDHSDTTLLDHVKTRNVYTASTGIPLDIKGDRRLSSKIIAYRKDPDVLKLHVPMPLKFLAPQAQGLKVLVPGMFRTSGLELRKPGAVRALTGV